MVVPVHTTRIQWRWKHRGSNTAAGGGALHAAKEVQWGTQKTHTLSFAYEILVHQMNGTR